MRYYQGIFKPRNPTKYKGNPTNIQYRSGWELKLFNYLDMHPEVVYWQSEEIVVPYRSPLDNQLHRYFPDIVYKTAKETVMIEIKPYAQTIPPILGEGRMTRAYKKKVLTYAVNEAKWRAARAYCADHKWRFQLMTEKDLGV